jgi:adhesin HecA-like repeat protein
MSTRRLITLLGAALVLSLAVNLFLVGTFAGRLLFGATETTLPATGRGGMVARFQALPVAERLRFRAAMVLNDSGLRAAQQALRAAQLRTLAALRATPYDKARMTEAFAALRAATDARQVALHAALAEALATLPPEARATLATGNGVTQP